MASDVLPFGPGFQKSSEEDEDNDGSRGVKIDIDHQTLHHDPVGSKGHNQAVEISGRGSYGDQGIHVARLILRRLPETRIKLPTHPELDRCGQ